MTAMHGEMTWSSLRRELEALAASVAAEILSYPRPITACDAQFNHLLELRRLVPLQLERLDAAAGDPDATIEAFVALSPLRGELAARTPAGEV